MTDDERILFKVLEALIVSGLSFNEGTKAIEEMQKFGIRFCERTSELEKDTRPHSRSCGYVIHPHGIQCKSDCPTCAEDRASIIVSGH